MAGQFTLTETQPNQFIFHLADDQENVLFTSTPFPKLSEAREAITELKRRAASFPNFERKKTPANEMYFVLRSAKGQILGSSKRHASIADLENSITAVNKWSECAQVVDTAA